MNESTPWARISQHSKRYWSQECTDTVKDARKLRRVYSENRTWENWESYQHAVDRKGKIVARHGRDTFRETVEGAGRSDKSLFLLAKWARNRSSTSDEVVPPLRGPQGEAATAREKAELLFQAHFPPPPVVDLSDMDGFEYPLPIEDGPRLTAEEVLRALKKPSQDKAPGPNGVPNRVLRACEWHAVHHIRSLFQACLNTGFQPRRFNAAATVMIRKPGTQRDYTDPKAYRPVALLDTLGKALESIVSDRIRFAVEKYATLPKTQMGARKQRSVDTALSLVTEKVHTIWSGDRSRVASLLCLDVAGAFDNVSHERLLYNMRKRRVLGALLNWVADFLKERRTTLSIAGYTLPNRRVNVGIPQGSPLSPILYLFYNADLLDVCEDTKLRTSATGFVDDVNILTYSTSTESNCNKLTKIYESCEEWASKHGSRFSAKKHELIHFTRTPKRFNMGASLQLGGDRVQATNSVRVLGVQLDSKLRWQPHVRLLQAKLMARTTAIQSITGSTWGLPIHTSRRVYSAVSRPAITHGAAAWYIPAGLRGHRKGDVAKLRTIQGQSLRAVTGAYRATSVEELEIETSIMPLNLHLEKLIAKSIIRQAARRSRDAVEEATRRIRNDIKGKRGRKTRLRPTPGEDKREWMERLITAYGGLNEEGPYRWRESIADPYSTPSWEMPLRVEIEIDAETAGDMYNADQTPHQRRIYTDGNGKDVEVTAAAVDMSGWEYTRKLGGPGIALVHHGELEGLTTAVEELARRCKNAGGAAKDLVYVAYTDSQASLKVVQGGTSEWDQARLRRIIDASKRIVEEGGVLRMAWIPGHHDVPGNERADRATNRAQSLMTATGSVREPTAKTARVWEILKRKWKREWIEGKKGRHLYA